MISPNKELNALAERFCEDVALVVAKEYDGNANMITLVWQSNMEFPHVFVNCTVQPSADVEVHV